jgi:hypothetical protein
LGGCFLQFFQSSHSLVLRCSLWAPLGEGGANAISTTGTVFEVRSEVTQRAGLEIRVVRRLECAELDWKLSESGVL